MVDEEKLSRVLDLLGGELEGMGFILFTFEFGPGGTMHYAGNCERHDGLTAMVEFLAAQDPTLMAGVVQRLMRQFATGPEGEEVH